MALWLDITRTFDDQLCGGRVSNFGPRGLFLVRDRGLICDSIKNGTRLVGSFAPLIGDDFRNSVGPCSSSFVNRRPFLLFIYFKLDCSESDKFSLYQGRQFSTRSRAIVYDKFKSGCKVMLK